MKEISKKQLKKEWLNDLKEKNLYCFLCGSLILKESELTIDHTIPKSKGGTDTRNNLKPAHKLCNNIRGAMDIQKFRKILFKKYNGKIELWWRAIHLKHIKKKKQKGK